MQQTIGFLMAAKKINVTVALDDDDKGKPLEPFAAVNLVRQKVSGDYSHKHVFPNGLQAVLHNIVHKRICYLHARRAHF